MNRQEKIEQLLQVQQNIEATEATIQSFKTSRFYEMFDKLDRQKHDIEIQEKCLVHWKKRFNSIINILKY